MEIKHERRTRNGDLKKEKKTEYGLTSYISTLVVLDQNNKNTSDKTPPFPHATATATENGTGT